MTSEEPCVGDVLDGKYRLEALVGTGGMGAVFKAEQLSLGRTVAVKVMRGAAASGHASEGRFRREALAVAKLKHPNIVAVYDFGVAEATGAYLVMEYLEGRSLRDETLARSALPVVEAVDLFSSACAAVHVSHEAGILHRDLKPQNIFLEFRGGNRIVKVLDFGLAKLFDQGNHSGESSGVETQTAPGVVVGTPLFMSPEQWLGDPLDVRSDVYSLGCVLYEMLVGHPPFWDVPRSELLMRKLVGSPRGASSIPGAFVSVLDRAMAPRPSDRFGSAAELANAVWSAVRGPQTAVGRPAFEDRGEKAPTRNSDVGARTNLPKHLTSFLGREGEIVALARDVDAYGCVTLTGPGGVGKTRLAIEVARGLARFNKGGVWFVDLAGLDRPEFLRSAVADALGLSGDGDLLAVREALGGERALLVLDNCEHVLAESASVVFELTAECPNIHVLATSREPLRVPGERVHSISGLPLAGARGVKPADPRESEAVRLFVERVRLAKPSFAPTEAEAFAVAELCEKLECLPLAIELAAACAKVLTVDEIIRRLGDRFRLLTGGGRTASPRHRTLRATIDWSYEHLTDEERALLRRLSIFAGGWSPDAADGVHHLLSRLVDKSLVIADDRDGETRYRMLETIREYARDKLEESGEADVVARVHRDWFLGLAERASDAMVGADQAIWLKSLGIELDNLRAALRWSSERTGEREPSLRMATALFRYFEICGRPLEGCRWIETALAMAGDAPPDIVASAHFGLGMLRFAQSDYALARVAVEECVRLRDDLGDRVGTAKAMNLESLVLHYLGDVDLATSVQKKCLAVSREFGLEAAVCQGIFHLGMLATARGEFDEAVDHFEESAALWRAMGNRLAAAGAMLNLCDVERVRGNLDRAATLIDECLEVGRSVDARGILASSCTLKGYLVATRGDFDDAKRFFEEAVELHRETGAKGGLVEVVESIALVLSSHGKTALAVRLVASTGEARRAGGFARDPSTDEEIARIVDSATQELGDAVVAEEESVGRALGIERAVRAALDALA